MNALRALSFFTSEKSLRRNSLPTSTRHREAEFTERLLAIMAARLTQEELEAMCMAFGLNCVARSNKEINVKFGKPADSTFAQSIVDRAKHKMLDPELTDGLRRDFRLPQQLRSLQSTAA